MKSTINILQIKTQSTLKFFKTFILGQVTMSDENSEYGLKSEAWTEV